MDYFCIFQKTTPKKLSPNRRKFAQSGHPVWTEQEWRWQQIISDARQGDQMSYTMKKSPTT
jgi:hypothetical protein